MNKNNIIQGNFVTKSMVSKEKKILLLSFGPIQSDPRIRRQYATLSKSYDMYTAGTDEAGIDTVNQILIRGQLFKEIDYYFNYNVIIRKIFAAFYRVYFSIRSVFIKLIRHFPKAWAVFLIKKKFCRKEDLNTLLARKFDLIIANDIYSMPLAFSYKQHFPSVKIHLDAHEYHFEEQEQSAEWRKMEKPLIQMMFKRYFSAVNSMSTVCDPIARRYSQELHMPVSIITNATSFCQLTPTLCHKPIKLIHHGACMRGRELHVMCDAVISLGLEYELTMMLVNSEPDYFEWLVNKYRHAENVKFVNPVPVDKIPYFINDFDIGVFSLPPVNYNWENALPNKLFEFIQARLCIVVTPNPAMKEIVLEYSLGAVSSGYSFNEFAAAIKNLTPKMIDECKINSGKAAAILCAENNTKALIHIVNEQLS